MRATLLGFGLLAAIGAGVATAVHAQVNQTEQPDLRPQFGPPPGTRYDGMLLADGGDTFSAARKMQGSQYYATGSIPPSAGTRNTDAPFGSSGANPTTDPATSAQQTDQNSVAPQSIYPSAGSPASGWSSPAAPTSQASKPRPSGAEAANASSANTGMKTLQQRLAALHNATGSSAGDARLPQAEPGTAIAAMPAPALAPTAAGQSRMMLQQDNQSASVPAAIQVGPSPTSIIRTSLTPRWPRVPPHSDRYRPKRSSRALFFCPGKCRKTL